MHLIDLLTQDFIFYYSSTLFKSEYELKNEYDDYNEALRCSLVIFSGDLFLRRDFKVIGYQRQMGTEPRSHSHNMWAQSKTINNYYYLHNIILNGVKQFR